MENVGVVVEDVIEVVVAVLVELADFDANKVSMSMYVTECLGLFEDWIWRRAIGVGSDGWNRCHFEWRLQSVGGFGGRM